jgi:Fur family ferric uptake transcriptional regulator
MRWTPQRRTVVGVLRSIEGHVSAAELIERCRQEDPTTTPSTVYRTLDVLEDLGIVCHGHDGAGREEYHVLPQTAHGHLYCEGCDAVWEIRDEVAEEIVRLLERRLGFEIDLSHVTISGRCPGCRK